MVVVLFGREDSIYKKLGCDVYDIKRDARTFDDRVAVIAHPPCRAWGRLYKFAKPRPDEKELAFFTVDVVRKNGGIIEHPASSKLWKEAGLPLPGFTDSHGGWTLPILQSWFGHRAPKATWLYIVGIRPADLPDMPFSLGIPCGRVEQMGKAEREKTPVGLAEWLIEVVNRINSQVVQ